MIKKILSLFKRKEMLKNLTINLDGPICNCDNIDASWGIDYLKDGLYLMVSCRKCGTKHCVRIDKMMASLHFDTPYPGGGGGEETKLDNVIKLVK